MAHFLKILVSYSSLLAIWIDRNSKYLKCGTIKSLLDPRFSLFVRADFEKL